MKIKIIHITIENAEIMSIINRCALTYVTVKFMTVKIYTLHVSRCLMGIRPCFLMKCKRLHQK